MTAHDVWQGGSVDEVERLVVQWAEQVWADWPAADRDIVRRLTDDLVPARYFSH